MNKLKGLGAVFVLLGGALLYAGAENGRFAEEGRFGLGVMVGEPTGLTGKYWVGERSAIDGAVGWSFERRTSLYLHGSYLLHDFELIPVEEGDLPLYAGIGGRLQVREGSRDRLGVRIPLGAAYLFEDIPVEIFGEIAPLMDVVPSTRARLGAGIGVRYYFD